MVKRFQNSALFLSKAFLLVGLTLAPGQAEAGFRLFPRHSVGRSTQNSTRPISQLPQATRFETVGTDEGLMRPGRWSGTVYQYPDPEGNFHTASRALVAEADGAFKQTVGSTLQTVEYSQGDVLFYVDGRGWHKSRGVSSTSAPAAPKERRGNRFEEEVLRLVNDIRRRAGLSALRATSRLMDSALEHTKFMARRRRLQHTTASVAENIAFGQSSPAEVVRSWMKSSGHRRNILNPNYKVTGVAAVADASGRLYWGQQFLF